MYLNSCVGCLPASSGVGFWAHPILSPGEGGSKKSGGYTLGELFHQHQTLGVLTPLPYPAPSLAAGYPCTRPPSPLPATSAGLAPLQALCSAPGVSAFMARGSGAQEGSPSTPSARPPAPQPLKFGISRILSEDFGKNKSEKENRYKLLGLGSYPDDSRLHPGCPCNSPACPAFSQPHHPHMPFPSPVLSAVTALQPPQYPVGGGADALPGPYSILNADSGSANQPKRKRSWSRAVFSNLQRKGLEKRFEVQKYVTKPDRRQLAAMLGLTDAQVKVWFQNRRMKWRHAQQQKEKEQQKKDTPEDEKIDVDSVQQDDEDPLGAGEEKPSRCDSVPTRDGNSPGELAPSEVISDADLSSDSLDDVPSHCDVTGSRPEVLSPETVSEFHE